MDETKESVSTFAAVHCIACTEMLEQFVEQHEKGGSGWHAHHQTGKYLAMAVDAGCGIYVQVREAMRKDQMPLRNSAKGTDVVVVTNMIRMPMISRYLPSINSTNGVWTCDLACRRSIDCIRPITGKINPSTSSWTHFRNLDCELTGDQPVLARAGGWLSSCLNSHKKCRVTYTGYYPPGYCTLMTTSSTLSSQRALKSISRTLR